MAAGGVFGRRGWRTLLPLLTALALVGAGLLIAVYNEGVHRTAERRDTAAQARILATTVTAALVFDDAAAVEEAVSALRQNPEIQAGAVYDVEGRPVARFGAADGRPPPATLLPGRTPDGATHRSVVEPVVLDGQPIGAVFLRARPESPGGTLARHGGTALLAVMAAAMVGFMASGRSVLRRANVELARRAQALAVQIAEREKVEEALRQSQKMEAIGQLTGGVAHDFNNLLMVASGGMDLLERTEEPKRRAQLVQGVRQALDRGAGLTRQLLAFARRSPLNPEVVDLAARVDGLRLLLGGSLREDVSVRFDVPDGLWPVELDPGQLEVAVLNLAVNARDAMPDGGPIVIAARNERGEALEPGTGEYVRLSLSDTGAGMTPETLARVFEPFFTTKEVGRGTGLGLSQVYGFTRASGGDVRIESAPGAGTTVSLLLPRAHGQVVATSASASEPAEHRIGGGGRMLLVEDDDTVADYVGQMVESLGWRLSRAASAGAALAVLEADGAFDLVFSDMVMPGAMNGVDLARAVWAERPHLPVLLTTGYSEAAARAAAEGLRLLPKPYRIDALAAELDRVERRPPEAA